MIISKIFAYFQITFVFLFNSSLFYGFIHALSWDKSILLGQVVVAHNFNPNSWEAEAGRFCEFNDSHFYKVSSMTDSKAIEIPCL